MIRHIHQAHRVLMSHPVIQTINKHLHRHVVAGFTLIEVLIVTSVVGVLASATTTRINNQQEIARNVARKAMVGQLVSTITTFYSNNRYRPSTLGSLSNYINTIPTDPKKIDTCHTAASANGQYGYLRYTGGGLSGDKDGFMLFSQVERGGQGIDYTKLYILAGSDPCQNTAVSDPSLVDWFKVANSVCTSKPGWTEPNPGWSGPLALNSLQQDVADVFGNRKVYAIYIGTGARTQPWVGVTATNSDGDLDIYNNLIANSSETLANRTNPCIPNQFSRNCDYDTDDDTIYDSIEGKTNDRDNDGIPNYIESNTNDRDDDGTEDEYDYDRPSCNGSLATVYVTPLLQNINAPVSSFNHRRIIFFNAGASNHLAIYTGRLAVPNGGQVVVATNDNDIITIQNGDYVVCAGDGNNTITIGNGSHTVIGGAGNDIVNAGNGDHTVIGGGGNNSVNVGNGSHKFIGGDGVDIFTGGNGDHQIFVTGGNDNIRVGNGQHQVVCGLGSDILRMGNGNTACSGCETIIGGSNSNSCVGSIAASPPTWTGIITPPTVNTARCDAPTTSVSSDPDRDSYINTTGSASNNANADSNNSDACLPNSRVRACGNSGAIAFQYPLGTCFDNDNDSYRNNVYHTQVDWDPNDQDPCNPSSNSCNLDIDEDGYRRGANIFLGDPLYDPDDGDPCNPKIFHDKCLLDTDGDGKKNFQEGETTNTDSFLGYPTTLGFDIYSGTYDAILNQGGLTVLVSGDNLYNRQEADRNTAVFPNADPDGDGVPNELDPANNNPCIPSNFGTGCSLDFDGDGIKDRQEGSTANTDTTGGYVADAYPDWIEALISGATTYWGLSNPSGLNSDPDGDNITNQNDPNNSNKCIPNTGADASCAGTIPPPPPSAIQGVDCASMTSLPAGARLYYIYTYQ